MNYLKIHDNIITKAKSEKRSKKSGIFELHHIIMKSIGGDDSIENTVLLTPREHFIIHLLLWMINNKSKKYRDPLLFFKNNSVSGETRKKISEANLGKKHSNKSIELMKKKAMLRPRWAHPVTGKLYDAGNLTLQLKSLGWSNFEIELYKKNNQPVITQII